MDQQAVINQYQSEKNYTLVAQHRGYVLLQKDNIQALIYPDGKVSLETLR